MKQRVKNIEKIFNFDALYNRFRSKHTILSSSQSGKKKQIKISTKMESKSYYNPVSLYSQCIVNYVKHLKPRTSQLDEIDGLQMLPPNILADIYLAVS